GQYPEQMFNFCRDIAFAEELCGAGFSNAGFLAFAEDTLFWSGSKDQIYGFFRGGRPLHGQIRKPTGSKDEEVWVSGSYLVNWKPVSDRVRYAAIEASNPTMGSPE